MKVDTPDVPTDKLKSPEQYVTSIGKVLRKTSLDEIPQIFNIFIGQMSFIGPRPALWNQKDLIKLRDKVHANDVRPGLSGWAQINGRDDISEKKKAEYDKEYMERLSFFFDCRCFFGTFTKAFRGEGVKG
jgi:O-antigen biosynthesis protein WbqP